MAEQGNEQQPLLTDQHDTEHEEQSTPLHATYHKRRRQCQGLLVSKQKHYLIMALVALDVSCLLADILIALIDCDSRIQDDKWVPDVREALEHAGLVFSCLFLVELLLCLWAFGIDYLKSWFHIFDALVIIASFLIDILTRGVVEEVGSLVIILRLWRFVKIVEELSVSASEQMEDLEMKVEQLEKENADLKGELKKFKASDGEE
ncbi:hypothetical protein M406DRAFT_358374 [Cryphonectria parasitica EP155]|uniref:Voltage-gated hydrogen channel 1 n=1 Tax=Cryphonectria parasitica (strain ATCC 38755 / EP155) TaxID=660469 RepID=A0A9P4XU71_CRYP1|nr:uncharacterized protein M406DRAFT_358374 [Cryphonectria parasitica EP155]KAF3760857.1 hypothetical protein M406DRAFT_358374 [Cryphonectria parasitica EP155]